MNLFFYKLLGNYGVVFLSTLVVNHDILPGTKNYVHYL